MFPAWSEFPPIPFREKANLHGESQMAVKFEQNIICENASTLMKERKSFLAKCAPNLKCKLCDRVF